MAEASGTVRPSGRGAAETTPHRPEGSGARALGAAFEAEVFGEEQQTSAVVPATEAREAVAEGLARLFAVGALYREAFSGEWGKEDDNGT